MVRLLLPPAPSLVSEHAPRTWPWPGLTSHSHPGLWLSRTAIVLFFFFFFSLIFGGRGFAASSCSSCYSAWNTQETGPHCGAGLKVPVVLILGMCKFFWGFEGTRYFIYLFILMMLGFELKALHLLCRHFTTCATPAALFCVILKMGSWELPAILLISAS
jgi:hypothetical protein